MFLKSMSLAFLLTLTPVMAQEAASTAKPLSFKECGAKYQAAKADGSVGGRKWLDYRRSECGITAAASNGQRLPSRSEASRTEASRRLVFPAALAGEFSDKKPWEARMRTCLKSYREAKKAGALYGVKWVEKGGGYYSLCSAKLRAAKV